MCTLYYFFFLYKSISRGFEAVNCKVNLKDYVIWQWILIYFIFNNINFRSTKFIGINRGVERFKKQNTKVKSLKMAGEQQQFFLKWNDFQSNMVSSFKHLRDEKSFTDVTLACDGQTCKAHKMVLSACSPYFKSLLEVWKFNLL